MTYLLTTGIGNSLHLTKFVAIIYTEVEISRTTCMKGHSVFCAHKQYFLMSQFAVTTQMVPHHNRSPRLSMTDYDCYTDGPALP